MMAELEKVIKGLTACGIECRCNKCPYETEEPTSDCIDAILQDALELLKAQVPRVLTLEEVIELTCDTPIYIENTGGLNGWDVFAGIDKDTANDVITGAQWSVNEYWPQEYGSTWRVWSNKPTDELMKAVKWDD